MKSIREMETYHIQANYPFNLSLEDNLDCHRDVTVMLAEHKLQPYRFKLIHS